MTYEEYLQGKLNRINKSQSLGLNIVVSNEQMFLQPKNYVENGIYVVVKHLASTLTFEIVTEPIQIMVLCEQNTMTSAMELFKTFVNDNNWNETDRLESTTYMKQSYTSPVDVSNFQTLGNGYRSVLYVSGTLISLPNVIDIVDLTINGSSIPAMNFSYSYQMTPNTQQISDELASSEKSTAGINLSFTMPFIKKDFTTQVLNICDGTLSGNTDFEVKFTWDSKEFDKNLKLTTATIQTAKATIPTLSIGMVY